MKLVHVEDKAEKTLDSKATKALGYYLKMCEISWFWLTTLWGIFWLCHIACGILVPRPGMEPRPPAVEVWSPNHWTFREFPLVNYFRSLGKTK